MTSGQRTLKDLAGKAAVSTSITTADVRTPSSADDDCTQLDSGPETEIEVKICFPCNMRILDWDYHNKKHHNGVDMRGKRPTKEDDGATA